MALLMLGALEAPASASCEASLRELTRVAPPLRRGLVTSMACWDAGDRVVVLLSGDGAGDLFSGKRERRLALAAERAGADIGLVTHTADPSVWMHEVVSWLPVQWAWDRPELARIELRVMASRLEPARGWARQLQELSRWQVAVLDEEEGARRDEAARLALSGYEVWTADEVTALVRAGFFDLDAVAGALPGAVARAWSIDEDAAADTVDSLAMWLEQRSGGR
jgi:hypothetical protein